MIPQKGLIFMSKRYNKQYYYNPWNNTQSWTPYNLETTSPVQNIGNWEVRLSRKINQPYFFNPVTNLSEWKLPQDYSIIFSDPLYDYYAKNGVPLASYIGIQSMIPELDITRITSGCEMVVNIDKIIDLIIKKSPNMKSIDFSKCTLTISNIKSLVKLQNLEQIIVNSDTIIPPLQKPLPFKIMTTTEEGYVRVALFYDILPQIYPEYGNKLSWELLDAIDYEDEDKVNEFIIEHDIPSGDIIYTSSAHYESRPGYGFEIVNRQDKSLYQSSATELFYNLVNDYYNSGETIEQNMIDSILFEIKDRDMNISTSTYYNIAAKQIIIFERDGILKGMF